MRPRIRSGGRFRRGDALVSLRNMDGLYLSNITLREAVKLISTGAATPSYYEPGKLAGIKLAMRLRVHDDSRTGITFKEILVYAGMHFAKGGSRTARMKQEEKRENAKIGKPAEDLVESTEAKIELWQLAASGKAITAAYSQAAVNASVAFDRNLYYEGKVIVT